MTFHLHIMKRLLFAFSLLVLGWSAQAQGEDAATLHATAKTFMRSGDFDNAILVLKRALAQDENNLEMQKDLVISYYVKRDYTRALEGVKKLIDRPDADEVTFQIAGNVYKALEEVKDCEKMYKKALKKFPKSGPLYSEYGELLWAAKKFDAIDQWEKGIEVDPNYSGNYFNASKFYSNTSEKIWSLLYGEIFLNLESFSRRTPEIKTLLFETYKQFFAPANISGVAAKSEFAKAYLETMKRHAGVVSSGVTPESISAVRTRFILDWYQKDAARFPFRLFDMQRQLLKEVMFEAYDQWIFGAAQDLNAFQNWTGTHAEEYNKFTTLQKSRVFKIPSGQYFNTASAR